MTGRPPASSRETKALIIDAALGLFEEHGYEATTMRAIADRAGVSVGNAYYYFASKDELIQGFYDRAGVEHAAASAQRLAGVTGLTERIAIHTTSWFDALGRHHRFAAQFFRVAADPASPLSPFSAQSADARDANIAQWSEVVEGADEAVPERLRDSLPDLLWLYHMGVILFWVHDASANQAATCLLIAATAPLIVRTVRLADEPALSALVDDVAGLLGLMSKGLPTGE